MKFTAYEAAGIRPLAEISPLMSCLLAALGVQGLSNPLGRELKKMFRGLEEIFGKAIKRGQESGEISTRFESGVIARGLVNTLNGIRVLEKTGVSVKEMNVIVDMAMASIKV
jgi:hypothetical protein